jgi:predicted dithiol-disulfide oxidoreductase (DUF899 family)
MQRPNKDKYDDAGIEDALPDLYRPMDTRDLVFLENEAPNQFAATCGVTPTYGRERPGMSAFTLENRVVYHTYSTYARGVDAIWGMYQWLDRAPKGRNETGIWWKRHDEYAQL